MLPLTGYTDVVLETRITKEYLATEVTEVTERKTLNFELLHSELRTPAL